MKVQRPLDWGAGAQHALIVAGACRSCARHLDILLRSDDADAEKLAYAIGTNMLKSGDVRNGPRQQFMTCIAEAISNLEDRCYICEAADQAD